MEQKQIVSSSVYRQIPPLSANQWWIVAQNLDAAEENEIEFQIFCNVYDPRLQYRCQIPELLGKHVRGCFYGWVILSDHPHNVMWSLWNPVTSNVINLPRLVYYMQPDSKDNDNHTITYCCLTSSPDDPDSLLLMTRARQPHFVFCRLHPSKNKKLRWTETSYAEQVKTLSGVDGPLDCLTCSNGKVYATAIDSALVVELSIVVKDTRVDITLLSLLEFPDLPSFGLDGPTRSYLVGSFKDIFIIFLEFHVATSTIYDVRFFKLHINSKTWEALDDLQAASIFLDIEDYLYPEFHSLAVGSEFAGYIHLLNKNGRDIHSYHVKDKTISLSSLHCLPGTSYVSTWPMLECKRLLEGDHEQEEDKKDKIVVSKVKSDKIESIGTTDESHLLNLPYDVLEMIIESCVGVEYMNFRASCKLCYLAAPIIHQTASKALQLQEYSLASPWLMVFGKHTITLIDSMFGDKYFIKTPHKLELVGELKIHCSRYGWLLMRKYEGPLFFFNPFTSDTRMLPEACYLDSFDFSAPPTSPNCIVVGFSSSLDWHVYIQFVGRESSWRRYALYFGNDGPDLYRFPAFYAGDVYALHNGKGVDVFEELGVGDNCEWKRVLDEVPVSSCTSKAQHFLVKCDHQYKCDQHLILVIVGEFGESVEVFIPNEAAAKWDKIDDIGRHAIYIGDQTCLCVEAKTAKMENKIYFPRLHSGKIVFYSLETRKFHTFNGGNVLEGPTGFFGTIKHLPHNAWIEPSWSAKGITANSSAESSPSTGHHTLMT